MRRGLAGSRAEAQEAVRAGVVTVGGVPVTKPATLVGSDVPLLVTEAARPYVSRGGGKLAAALDRFAVPVTGRVCLDAGASTGGFTDCLLQRGASRVYAVDVGYGQLAWPLRTDPRVVVLERTNIRTLSPAALGPLPDLIVADLSFISLGTVLAALAAFAPATIVALVKPQFEAGRADVGSGGVVRDPAVWRRVLEDVLGRARKLGYAGLGVMASPLPGPAGNIEFLVHLEAGEDGPELDLDAAILEGEALRR